MTGGGGDAASGAGVWWLGRCRGVCAIGPPVAGAGN